MRLDEMSSNMIEIKIKGQRGCGKTTVLNLIRETLVPKGFVIVGERVAPHSESIVIINEKTK